jgi:hypothetical protein
MTLENLVGKGLQKEAPIQEEIQRLLAKAETRLADAANETISRESRFDLAYEALLQLAICALRANGYRPDSRGGHHVIALQGLAKSIGYPKEKIRLMDEFRRQRAIGLYDGSFDPSETELKALLTAGKELKESLTTWIQENHPELT